MLTDLASPLSSFCGDEGVDIVGNEICLWILFDFRRQVISFRSVNSKFCLYNYDQSKYLIRNTNIQS